MEDRISALPDGILCHILSFLPTRDTIATSCLSKRWCPLWRSVPALDLHLDDQTYLQSGCIYSPFLNFAYATLLSHNAQQPLMLVRLRINTRVGPNYIFPKAHFNILIKAVIKRGIKHLHLEMPLTLPLPSSVFNCKTLVVLKLWQVGVDILQSIDLPVLKILHLDYVRVGGIGYISRILRGCPVLEELRANRVNFGTIVGYQSMPKLVRANIGTNFGVEFPLEVVKNFVLIILFILNYLQVIYLKLLQFNHQQGFPLFPNLIHLELNFVTFIKWYVVFELLIHCPNLQTFVLNKPMARILPQDWACPRFVPECISSQLRRCTVMNYKGTECELQFVKYILHHARALQTMTIQHCLNMWDKFEMLQQLAMCPRGSATCKLLFK
uniref:F-box/FBD/LRR-repeat protein At4g26340 family n=1 Tax=Cajanus cajan TaxID=3821 RepID=A0A151SNK5_CAJCA|nr:F-box/FBD/LRR-repeat protein At4g26340 family [Cajanus cajan]KYP56363.1 F-box/FBD/LRR-repeat protein At4g26340 family [Cajanus cajan]